MDSIEAWTLKIFAFWVLGTHMGSRQGAEIPCDCVKRVAAAKVSQLTPVPFHLASKSAAFHGRMCLPFANIQAFPPVLPFSNGNQSISLLRPSSFVPLFFSSAPSLFVCFKELSWRESFTGRGELSTPPARRLCQVTAPSAAGAWTRLKKNIIGIFNFPVWSWEMKSHHERSLPGAVSR